MYDPIVVDAFFGAFADISPSAIRAGQEARSMLLPTGTTGGDETNQIPLRQIRATASEAALLQECRDATQRATNAREAFEPGVQCLRQVTPATVVALYRYRVDADALVCTLTAGDQNGLLDGLTIKLGQRITGWAAAGRRASANSDAALDLRNIADMFRPALRSAVSVPLIDGNRVIGALTVYSLREQAFSETQSYVIEQVAGLMNDKLRVFWSGQSTAVLSFAGSRDNKSSNTT
jgi:putative methionine-R-sulfoxide reductase with GAF domain